MTKEEIIEAIQDDKMMPYIEPYQLSEIVDFVIRNYKPSLPSNLDEAAHHSAVMVLNSPAFLPDTPFSKILKILDGLFKAGAEWREAQIPKLPDNLDDAAWNYVAKKYGIKESEKIFENEEIAEDFKAGAEWMAAGQGVRAHCVESANPVSESPDVKLHIITLLYEENEYTPYVRGGDNIDIIIRKK